MFRQLRLRAGWMGSRRSIFLEKKFLAEVAEVTEVAELAEVTDVAEVAELTEVTEVTKVITMTAFTVLTNFEVCACIRKQVTTHALEMEV
jgi:hypothetical protein